MSIYRVVTLILGWQLAASICYYAVFASTPFFKSQYNLSGGEVGLVVTALTLGYAVFLLPLGALTDRYGEHRMLTIGLVGLSFGALLITQAWSYFSLLFGAFLLGSLYGTAMPGTNKAIFDNTPSDRQNLAIGIKQVGVTAGSGASALLITSIAGVLFWEAGYYTAALAGLLMSGVFWVFYRTDGGSSEPSYPDFRELLSNRPYRSLTGAGVCLGAGLFTTTGYTILYIDESLGGTVAFGGIVLAALQVSGSVGRIITGWLSDILPGKPRQAIGGVLLIQSLGSALLFVVVAIVQDSVPATVSFILLGFFILGCTGVYYSCMATLVSPDQMGGATAGGQLALTSGALFAPPLFGYLSDAVSYQVSWLMLAGLAIVATIFVARVIVTEPPTDVTVTGEQS